MATEDSTTERATYTPGPWKVSGLDPQVIGPLRLLVVSDTQSQVPQLQAVARVVDRSLESEANAHLIAAAPDLLYAVRQFFTIHDGSGLLDISVTKLERARRIAIEAIAKAEGRA